MRSAPGVPSTRSMLPLKLAVRLAAISDPDPARGEARAKEFGIAKVYQDRERMKNDWSGYPGIAIEDAIMAVTAGPIADRTQEHLVPADGAVVRIRRLLLESAARIEKGGDPIGVDYSNVSLLRAPTEEIKDGDRWQDLVPQHKQGSVQAAE